MSENFSEKLDKIEKHIGKTCDELKELDKKMVRFDERLDNHLKNTEKTRINKRESRYLIVAVFGATIAMFTVLHTIFGGI